MDTINKLLGALSRYFENNAEPMRGKPDEAMTRLGILQMEKKMNSEEFRHFELVMFEVLFLRFQNEAKWGLTSTPEEFAKGIIESRLDLLRDYLDDN